MSFISIHGLCQIWRQILDAKPSKPRLCLASAWLAHLALPTQTPVLPSFLSRRRVTPPGRLRTLCTEFHIPPPPSSPVTSPFLGAQSASQHVVRSHVSRCPMEKSFHLCSWIFVLRPLVSEPHTLVILALKLACLCPRRSQWSHWNFTNALLIFFVMLCNILSSSSS